jgi:hypothetical protein
MKRVNVLRASLLAAVFLAGSGSLTGAAAHATGLSGLAIELRPSDAQGSVLPGDGYYQVVAQPGETVQLYAFVGNRGRQPAGIDLVPVDAASGEYGAISYDLPGQRRRMVGAWVTLSHRWVSLAPDQGIVVPFTVHVPHTARSGQYIGGLSAFVPAPKAAARHGIGLTVQTRILDAIEVTIPGGSKAQLRVTGLTATYRSNAMYVLVHIRNTGTVLLKGRGYLWVYAPHSSKPWIHRSFALDTTVPGTDVHYPLHWAHRVPPGPYRYSVVVSWSGGAYGDSAATDVLLWRSGRTERTGTFQAP